MAQESTRSMIEGLSLFLEGFIRNQYELQEEFGATGTTDGSAAVKDGIDLDTAVVIEMRAVMEGIMEAEDYSPEELAALTAVMTDAIEQISPEVFQE